MGLSTKATDWQVFGSVSIAGGAGLGAGLYLFDFYSATAGVAGLFSFRGVGIGEGGNLGGLGVPEDVGPLTQWSSLECERPFSLVDLNGAWGRLTALGAAVGVGWSAVFITAAPHFWSFQTYFASQFVGGLSQASVGGGGQVLVGGWEFKRVSNRKATSSDHAAVA